MSNYDEYLICQRRGHTHGDSAMCVGDITWYTCKFCKTSWWEEVVHHYRNEPEPPDDRGK